METPRLQKVRYDYLVAAKKYREEGRLICYLDETWYDSHNTVIKGRMDSSSMCQMDVPVSRGKRIIICHIKSSSLDYHQDMTSSLFEEWFCYSLLPSLPKEANDFYYEDHYTKKQLLEVMNTKEYLKHYYVDNRAKEAGHTVLRLPPYHCVLNPTEVIWAQLKNMIRFTNQAPKLSESIITCIKNAMQNVSAENWKNAIQHVITKENEYLNLYNTVAPLIINLQEDSNTDANLQEDSSSNELRMFHNSGNSMSVLKKKPCNNGNTLTVCTQLLRAMDVRTQIYWIKGHTGIREHDIADELAKKGCVDGRPYDPVLTPVGPNS
ncbi:hypothetical protein MML48_1g10719 [Holotrichia oblita]|uniref:Uncharacterized protein n=1 Tax=Holotrichia oblita TaxID=644536 RepID=A0ACB9TVN0_HOLOL|nr:hypothetical protein MML48_1g10719 [Holotrichia oblita]